MSGYGCAVLAIAVGHWSCCESLAAGAETRHAHGWSTTTDIGRAETRFVGQRHDGELGHGT